VRSSAVERILADNGYKSTSEPQPGDVAVFRNPSGEVTHTGVVRAAGEGSPVLVESKWGRGGRFIHGSEEHAYRGQQVTYYLSRRGDHLLQGLSDESPSPAPMAGELVEHVTPASESH
jgi:hypothetical protein